MQQQPPSRLIDLLQRLGLATEPQLRGMSGRVRRLARELPLFESVWVDALAQARILTAFQAAEINAGRGDLLRVGPYVVCEALEWLSYGASYRARQIASGEVVRLTVVENSDGRAGDVLRRLEALAAKSGQFQAQGVAPVVSAGADGDRCWAASAWVEGRTAAQWLVHNGRFPPEVVLEIARQMLVGLTGLEKAGLCHGDISAWGLTLTDGGDVVLMQPGLRAILRPEEGYAQVDLAPEAYDYVAPERVSHGTRPTVASDVYACGCVWWQLLTGRPPLPGGNSLAKLRSAEAAAIPDVRQFAPETPGPLAAAVSACVLREPDARPESMARLAAMLGLPTRAGKAAIVRCLSRSSRASARPAQRFRAMRASSHRALWLAGLAGCLVAAASILWPAWRGGWLMSRSSVPAENSTRLARSAGGTPAPRDRHTPHAVDTKGQEPAGLASTGGQQGPGEQSSDRAGPRDRTGPADLVLTAGGPLAVESLKLQAGQHVRGMPGQRPLVVVPPAGLVIRVEDVHFENIDFLWDPGAKTNPAAAAAHAVIDLQAGRVGFHGCRFQADSTRSARPAAIRWTLPVGPSDAALSLPSGRLQMSNCILRGVDAVVDCRTAGALAVELSNALVLGTGPLLRLEHYPAQDEPLVITLSRVTLRNTGPLLECHCQRIQQQPGGISIRAAQCALLPEPGTALLLLSGPESPERLLENVQWTGEGSLLAPQAVVAAWRPPEGRIRVLDDSSVAIAGLVRSEVQFAGKAEAGPAASRLIRWQAPLRSTEAPGVDPDALPGGQTTAAQRKASEDLVDKS